MSEVNYIASSQEEALSRGLKFYFTGLPCKNGHIANRFSSSKCCVKCRDAILETYKAKLLSNPELLEARRLCHRKSKAKARQTPDGRLSHYKANKKYIEGNRDKIRSYYRTRVKEDPVFRMSQRSRSILYKVLARANLRKSETCHELLGYTGQQLKQHIERQFTKGMNWSLVGKEIHIDHIIPVAEMLRNGETRPSVINALSNLRPMWAKDNIKKSDKVLTLL